jgi:ABC-type transport system substrate-binding protein
MTGLSGCSGSASALKGKVLRLVLEDNIKTTDPTNQYDVISAEVAYQIYETPYQYAYYSDDQAELVPMLADGMPQLSKDRLTYTFKIKKGVRYQDDACFQATGGKGRELKAQDFVYAWKRHANPANESQGFWIWDGKIAGVNDFQRKFDGSRPQAEVMKDEVQGFKALDDHTLQLKLTKPYPQLTYVMTMMFTSPVPPECVEHYGKDFQHHPVGTGPFRVKDYNSTSRVVLVKNENFREELFPAADKLGRSYKHLAANSGKRLPLVDAIEFTVVKEEQPRWLGFLSGKYDTIKIPKDNFNSAIQNRTEVKPELAQKGIFVSIEPALSFWYVSINMKDKVLRESKYLRQAIASAIDRETWLQMFKNGRGSAQTEVNPPGLKDRCGKPYKWTYDLNRAKQLLAKAGFPEGKGLGPLRWDTRRTEMSERQLAELIQKNLAQIGVKIEVVSNTFPIFLDKSHKRNLMLSKGGFVMDYPDVENNLQLLYGPNESPGPNEANFDHAEYNKLYEKIATMPSGPERRKLVCRLEEIIQDEAPWAYGIYEDEYRLAQRWLKGFHTAELVYTKWKFVDVDEKERDDLLAKR